MTPQRHKNTYKLSPIQEGMLFHHLNAQHSGVDIEQIICNLAEPVQIEPLKSAWRQIVDRHDVLRTSFEWQDRDEPCQNVHRTVELPFDVRDMSKLSPAQQHSEFEQWLREDRTTGFELNRAPLYRLNLFRLAENEWTLVWTLHHAILDGRSFPIVLSEVFRIYDAQLRGTGVDLPAVRPYSDYIEFLGSIDFSQAERYWREILKGFAGATPLGALEEHSGQSGQGEEEIQLSASSSQALAELASRERFTVNNAVQAAWAVVLSRYGGSSDIVFGSTRACRGFLPRAGSMVGTFINTLPVRVKITGDFPVFELLRQIRASQIEVRDYEHTPLTRIQSWSDLTPGSSLFESILVFDHAPLNSQMKSTYLNWENRKVHLEEHTNFPITLYANAEPELTLRIAYDRGRFGKANIQRALEHLRIVLEDIATGANKKTADLPMLSEPERRELLETWNNTATSYPHHQRIHDSIEAQVRRSPDQLALIFRDEKVTYAELNRRADQLAGFLISQGVKAESKVGIYMRRSTDMVVALLAVLKSGGAYVPLDPSYPADRIQFIIDDAQAAVILTEEHLRANIQAGNARVVALDSEWSSISALAPVHPPIFDSDQLAYVIYTSGSTGKPKGVMVTHRNVMNFFTGMDQKLGSDPGVWLATTSVSFDISVLELFWTLSRGFRVVLQEENKILPESSIKLEAPARPLDFSLFYFASDESQTGSKYDLLLAGAKFADQNGFSAVWTPERHFHAFGGLFPNPSVVSAALAMVTKNVQIRAGSVVLPLHDPIRVAEEWAVVDQLSQGRVGLSFASGWHDRDFVFAPDDYQDRKQVMARDLEKVRALWRGEKITRRSGSGKDVQVSVCPRPVQPELPVWITAGGDPNTFRAAGQAGANLLTHLLGQSLDELKEKITVYRKAIQEQGGTGHVTLMLHTFVGNSQEEVAQAVREPLSKYLKSSVDLMKQVARGLGEELGSTPLSENDLTALIDHGFERYYQASGLFGTPETCLATVRKLQAIGVDEIACLVDFGIDAQTVLTNLGNLHRLMELAKEQPAVQGYSIPEQIVRHHVTHMQCTPSMARMLVNHESAHQALGSLDKLLVGGEALPPPLAEELTAAGPKAVCNMYGPTETTIWSTMDRVEKGARQISIGRPIANTRLFVLNENRGLLPAGVSGELYIGGEGVARGYWNRPELTAERFVEIALDKKVERVYRTGDLVRYLSDGRLEFLGRVDNQVKIRGHRIELGEIETVLCAHPNIQQAVVSATEDAAGDIALAAYVVPTVGNAPSAHDLRTFLGEKLPPAMVPNAFVPMDAFPLTPNSKVDRKRLPKPQAAVIAQVQQAQREDRPPAQPADELEAKLAEVWCSVLDVPSIGVEDDFFESGGHSLKAVRLFSAIKSKFKVELPLATLLHSPTVRGIARTLRDSSVQEQHRSSLVALQPNGTKAPLFCIGALDGELILFRKLIAELGEDQPVYGLQPSDLKHDPSMLLDVKKIAGYYIDQLHAAGHERPHCLIGYSFGGLVALEMAQQLHARGIEVPGTVLIDTHYFAGCRRNEGIGDRLHRYKYHLQQACQGPSGLGHLADRMKHASRNVVYRAASTKALGGALEVEADISKIQECAGDSYRAKPYAGRVCVLKASEPLPFFEGGPKIGWDGIFNDNLSIFYEIPGDHGTINTEKNTGLMARRLVEFLSGVESWSAAPVLDHLAS